MKIIILAGGKGTRLWPLSNDSLPKQFLALEGSFSLLQNTLLRFLKKFHPEDIVIVTNKEQAFLVEKECAEINASSVSVLIEPSSLNTGPAFCFALKSLQEEGKLSLHEPVLLAPCDAYMEPALEFLEAIDSCIEEAISGSLVLFGVPPVKVETGYGYIQASHLQEGVFRKVQFQEKPTQKLIEKLLLEDNVFWNTGHLLCTPQFFWQEVETHASVLLQGKESISLDQALLEKSEHLVLKKLSVTWSDLGSWDSVYEILPKTLQGNVLKGEVVCLDSQNSLFWSKDKPIRAIGVQDLLVVDTKEALFIGKRGCSQSLKELVLTGKDRWVIRPWGSYTVLEEGLGYKVKKILVEPGHRLSLQMHKKRSEHWVVVKGTAFVEVGEKSFTLKENENVFIPSLTCHRLSNQEDVVLEVIEIQSGSLLQEEDIVRFEDDYARPMSLC